MPQGESVVAPSSYCPKCKQKIVWYDNIPLVSFLLLGGRCRACKTRISFRYPVVELASGLIWYASWVGHGPSLIFLITVAFLSILLAISLIDLETGLIPDRLSLPGMVLGLILSFFYPMLHQSSIALTGFLKSLIGLLAGGGLIYITGLAGNWIFQRESMGGGDVKLLAMVGSFLGWEKVLLTFFAAPFFALPFALYQRWVKKEEIIPYGPFLSLAAAVQFYYGDILWRYFLVS
ncbi:MAG: prepilin peptidase [Candidatus Omnitrophica bacterium]|nr:prepilin peptidase [Candidatus Omnitrophota bacterium]